MSCDKYECNTEYAIKMKHCNRIAILQLENPLFKGILGDILPVISTTSRTVFSRPFFAPYAPETRINRAFVSIQLQIIPMGVARKCHLGK